VAAVRGLDADCFGRPVALEELVEVLTACGLQAAPTGASVRVALPADDVRRSVATAERARLLAHSHGWRPQSDTPLADAVTLSPVLP
jgi:coenzyme F420-0:L-glutamate ligase/coenzyme F420-1:gamma-L-glutamate ligase